MDIGKQKGYKRPMTLKKTIEQHISIWFYIAAGAVRKGSGRLPDGRGLWGF